MSLTIRCIRERTNVSVTSWRNHAYRTDRNTHKIAASLGIRRVSNCVTGVEGTIRPLDGIFEVPINTPPDHESLGHDYHARRFRSVHGWVDEVLRQVEYQQAHNLPSVILAHPLCMFVEENGLAAFERLCVAIGGGQTAPMRECT